jgi:thioredoxin-like negative regulator of GroEL
MGTSSNNWNIKGIITGISLAMATLLMHTTTYSQEHRDTLQFCKGLKDAGNIKDSYRILKTYLNKHPKEFNAIWFTAKLAYWNWEIDNAKNYYQSAFSIQPKNYYLKLDYAMMLVEIGEQEEAIVHLEQYIKYDSLSKDAQLYLAKSYYWQGNTSEALRVLNHLPVQLKNNELVKELRHEILLVRATNLDIKTGYDFDDQPLKHITAGAAIHKYESNLLNWSVEANTHQFKTDSSSTNAYSLEAGNKFSFYKLGMQLHTRLGATSLPFANTTLFTGALGIQKKLYPGISLLLSAERKPYFFTSTSTQVSVLQTEATAAIAVENLKQFSGKLQYQQQLFDGNTIKSFSAWVLTPALKLNKFSIKAGYAYQQADADVNNYTSNKSIDSLFAHYTTPVTGYYIPYFTPKSQQIHSALLWLNYKPSGRFSLTATGSYGLSASLSNPYLYLTNLPTDGPMLAKAYTSQTYTPIDASLKVLYKFNERVSANASYEYHKTNFYTGQFINATINILLLNEHQ